MKALRLQTEHEVCPIADILESKLTPGWVQRQFETNCLKYTLVGPIKLHVKTHRGWVCAPDDGYLVQGPSEIWPIEKSVFEDKTRYRVIEEV